MTEQQNFLIEGIVGDMALWVMQEREVTLDLALSLIYNSITFEKLIEIEEYLEYSFKVNLSFNEQSPTIN